MHPSTTRRATRRAASRPGQLGLARSRALVASTAVVVGLGLAGCADAGQGAPEEGVAPPSAAPQATEDAGVTGTDPTSAATEPTRGECNPLPFDEDGDYAAGAAGTARVPLDGDALSVEEVTPAEGWEQELVTEEADEVEIEFTDASGEQSPVQLRVRLVETGLAEAEVCAEQ